MSLFGRTKKVKISTTIREETSAELRRVQEVFPDDAATVGEAIDLLVGAYASLTRDDAGALADAVRRQRESREAALALSPRPTGSEFALAEQRLAAHALTTFSNYLYGMFGLEARPSDGSPTDWTLADGSVVPIPDDWVVINPEDAPQATHVGVIEVHNCQEAPHFAFFKPSSASVTASEQARLIALATKAWPPLAGVRAAEVPPAYDAQGNVTNAEEHLAAPVICFFDVLDREDYETAGIDPPCGVSVNRARA